MIWNLRNFKYSSRKQVVVDAHDVIIHKHVRSTYIFMYITAWVSALLIWNYRFSQDLKSRTSN